MRLAPAIVEVIERAYDIEAPTRAWLDSIRDAAERAFSDHVGVQAFTFSITADGHVEFYEISSDPEQEAVMRRAHERADPAVLRRLYLRGPVASVIGATRGDSNDPGYQEIVRVGVRNAVATYGLDPSGHGCGVAFLYQNIHALSRSARVALERVAAHLASARRLRESLGPTCPADALMADAEAVLAPDGTVVHAQGAAREDEARRALRDAARRIDRARCRRGPASQEEALALWRGLVDGTWSLVERFESDGRRFLVARRNEPPSRATRTLDERERKIVALLALGHSLKLCAYELGRAESTVSRLARSAMVKMGIGSRDELVAVHGAIVGSHDDADSPKQDLGFEKATRSP